ncbi:MAG: hypothetical protein ACI8QD_002112, partial [Cyclobacteriaceae bacterium]
YKVISSYRKPEEQSYKGSQHKNQRICGYWRPQKMADLRVTKYN